MPTDNPNDPRRPWEEKLHQAGTRIDEDLRRVVKYLNDEVVPDIRRTGSEALRSAAAELHRLAQRMDDSSKTPPTTPGNPPRP